MSSRGDKGCLWILLLLLLTSSVAGCYFPLQLSVRRPGATIAALNDKIYFVGSSLMVHSAIIDVLDTTSNTWSVMHLDPPRITVRALGVAPKYLVLVGGYAGIHLYRFIVIMDVTTNEQYPIPYPDKWWSTDPTILTINIHVYNKVVAYVRSGRDMESDILIIDPATKSVDEIPSDGILLGAVTNGTHLFALTRQGPKVLDVEARTWSDLLGFPTQVRSAWIYMAGLDAVVVVSTDPLTFRVHPVSNGSDSRAYSFSGLPLGATAFSDTDIYLPTSGTLAVIRTEDFRVIQYRVPQNFFTRGAFSLVHNGVIYITTHADVDAEILTINTRALFERAQLSLESGRVMLSAGDNILWLAQNLSWYNMNTRQYHTLDWPTRRQPSVIPVVGQYVIVASGNDLVTNTPLNALDIFDTKTQTWTSHTMPYAFRAGRVFVFDDHAFFFAGQHLYVFNPYNHTWRDFPMVVAVQFYVAHNRIIATYFDRMDVLDVMTGNIVRIINLGNVVGGVVGSLFVGTDYFGNVTVYDAANDIDTRHRILPRRMGTVTTVENRFVIFVGGSDLQERRLTRIDVFDTLTLEWKQADLPLYARGADPLVTEINGVVILVRHRRIDQLNPATMELTEIVLEVDDIIRVFARGSKVIFVAVNSVTLYETSTGEYFTARFDPAFRIQNPSDNFVFATFENSLEYRQLSIMTGVIDSLSLFEGESTAFKTSASGPYATARWSHNGEEMVDMNGKFALQLDNVTRATDGDYRIEVRDLCNQRMQQQARLTVHGRPMFTDALRDTINLCDEPAMIETHVTGKNMTLEWRINDEVQSTAIENITIAPNRLQCDTSYSLCLTATNPSGANTTCAALKLVKLDSLIRGPRPTTNKPTWFLDTQVELEVEILDSDCMSHSWFINNQTIRSQATDIASSHSTLRVNVSALTQHQEFSIIAHCGNSDVRSRTYVFQNVSTLTEGWLAAIIVVPTVVVIAAVIIAVFVRRRLAKSQSAEIELQSLLTQAKSDSLRRDGVSVIPSTTWEWTPGDDFTYRPFDALPCKIDISMIKIKSEPVKIDVWMQNEVIFSSGGKNALNGLKERLIDGVQVNIYSPKSPKYEVRVEPASFVIKEGKSVHVTISSLMRMTTKCKISLVLVFDQQKVYSAIEYKVESSMSTWIDLDDIEQTGEYLGGGGFGSVTRGVYRGQQVAVKRLLSQYLTPEMKIEFEREVTLMKDLRHPNIVSFIGASNVNDNLAIVIEYAPLGSLSSVMQKMKLTTSMKLAILHETAKAIQFLHMNSVIHRDIKPQNILVFSLEPKSLVHVKLTDFGTSRFISDDKMTVTKNVGTISYMSPEALGKNPRIDKSADIYSFAILMWEVMTEQQPFSEYEWHSDIEMHVKEGKRLGIEPSNNIDAALVKLIEDCWHQDPASRPPITSVVERLTSLLY
jgi:tRNA A-37 threonylcarbamoyl transferase component Bud32